MKVTFTKRERRYDVYVSRDRATDLFIRSAPGYDEWLPHDLLHFVAEAELGLDTAIFGDLARGGNARIFIPVDRDETAKLWRRRRMKKVSLPDGRRSEQLASELEQGWRARTLEQPLLGTLDALARRWHALAPGESLTLEWPRPERRRPAAATRPRRARRRSRAGTAR